MQYKICEWEDNGYHDSYFYGVLFDDAIGLMHEVGLGATAFAGGYSPEWLAAAMPTLEIVERCRLLLVEYIFTKIREAEHIDVFTPSDARKDEFMVLLEDHKRQVKAPVPCEKCCGKGYWQNPNKDTDRRPCFGCNGKGTVAKGDALKDAKGRLIRETIPAGARLAVLACTAFGSFFRNGYNKPGRDNRSVTGRLDSGAIVNVPLKKLRHERDPMSDEELRERAVSLSHHHQYGAMFGCRAWLSANYAEGVVKRAKAAADTEAAETAAAAA